MGRKKQSFSTLLVRGHHCAFLWSAGIFVVSVPVRVLRKALSQCFQVGDPEGRLGIDLEV